MSRAYTAEECRARFMDHFKTMIHYWQTIPDPSGDRIEGFAFSVLSMFDGATNLPAFDIIPSPHESDKDYHIAEGSDYWPNDVVINDCQLHELFYRK